MAGWAPYDVGPAWSTIVQNSDIVPSRLSTSTRSTSTAGVPMATTLPPAARKEVTRVVMPAR